MFWAVATHGRQALSALLVVRPTSLGDIVHALALVEDVALNRPGMAIDWVCDPSFAPIARLSPRVRNIIPFGLRRWRRAPFVAMTLREIADFRRALRAVRYEAILDLQEQVKGGVVARMARGVRHGFDRASIREPIATVFDDVHHAIPKNVHFASRCRMLAAAALGYAIDGPPRWRLEPPAAASVVPGHRHAVVLHSTSRADKLWPEADWRRLIAMLQQGGVRVLLPSGNAVERERSSRLIDGFADAHACDPLTLAELAALLAKADIVVGIDTGLTHLAAALRTPTIALFTSTDPAGAGVAIAGSHTRDLGGNGTVPSFDDVRTAMADLIARTSRC
ncbi:MAG TPA: lipopolysaccharide heptosyltransferase I [Casimicrobiaceae bacterium]|nr:lipopolysaccharide heptosyltransferase I [Casimicrobiaceae bacterium]